MSLPWREKLSMLLPPSVFYRRRIDYETATGEPELALLDKLMRHGATAVDIGANQGFFAFALAELSRRVVCFEPNPDYARFARWMLRGRAEVHAVALADKTARANFYVPHSDEGLVLHLAGSLKRAHHHFKTIESYEVEVRTLDDFALTDVSFIKLDVEGSERDVLEGARATIARERPPLLIELLSGTHDDPGALTAEICRDFDYEAFLVHKGETIPALPAIAALGKNTSWGTEIETRNVLFVAN
ncbi:MAG TPA: FkbM family methyltransferase [Pseudolabrys sp.]|nr:FkbM family methyltransferase [Pseudolabrys sp.]